MKKWNQFKTMILSSTFTLVMLLIFTLSACVKNQQEALYSSSTASTNVDFDQETIQNNIESANDNSTKNTTGSKQEDMVEWNFGNKDSTIISSNSSPSETIVTSEPSSVIYEQPSFSSKEPEREDSSTASFDCTASSSEAWTPNY